ncbi:class I SAM-dependent methyltransferase, partial [Candidatus Micrarchaeota archaeon]|nr:class I SAM-dependent methyltransferase [Candidatus Micrarchaeota archaeon]
MELTKISEIKQMSNEAMALFDWSAVPLGHPIRNHAYAYPSWGIVITPDNIEGLRQLSKEEYAKEWVPTDENLNHLIAIASERAGLSDTNMLLNEKIGQYSAEHILSLKHNAPRIIEVGTGAGGTILSVLNSMILMGVDVSKLDITLVEPSQMRLDFAQDQIAKLLQTNGLSTPKIRTLRGTVDALDQVESGFAHLVFQNAAIHHESFTDHLPNINRILKPEMPFISGDWHEGSYETP